MPKSIEMMCPLKVLKYIESVENLNPGSLQESGAVHGCLAWSKDDNKVRLVVSDDSGDVMYKVGSKLPEEWSAYFKMHMPSGERLINPADFRTILHMINKY
jgi:hypothetical protein